jgi:hypothetical protein
MENMTQASFIKKYNEENRTPFNPDLFMRSEDDIITELEKVILSCQRDKFFIIQVEGFEVIKSYAEVSEIMRQFEGQGLKNKSSNRKSKINSYEYINLKDTDAVMLKVKYYIRVKNEYQHIEAFILVPRVVHGFYFRISGNYYLTVQQIVDASTYNDTTSKSKTASITHKTLFNPIKVYRYTHTLVNSSSDESDGQEVKVTSYQSRLFSKAFPILKYILAKYGLAGAFNFLGINCIEILDCDPKTVTGYDDCYKFSLNNKRSEMCVAVPKMLLDNDLVTQALTYALVTSISATPKCSYDELFTNDYWKRSLGAEFNATFTTEKGDAILYSFENLYDIRTRETTHLPLNDKKDIYCITRWIIREFNNLRLKDNLDISTKRVRCAEHIASLYAARLAKGIYRLSDKPNKIGIDDVRKSILIQPKYLLKTIVKSSLVNYRDQTNCMDSIGALKFSYKGNSGIGNSSSNKVPDIYRTIHPSHIGRVDLDSSSKSDPGMSGIMCPTIQLYDNSFTEFEEPNSWREEYLSLLERYEKTRAHLETLIIRHKLLGEDTFDDAEFVESCMLTTKDILKVTREINDSMENEDSYFIKVYKE